MRDAPLVRPTVLEIGSGTGGVGVALLEMGASAVHGIDLSSASVDVARRRAAAAGFEAQASFEVGEGTQVSDQPVDWVIMDRVLCCDRRAQEMLAVAMKVAARRIALSVPDSRGWRGLLNHPMWAAENVWDRFRGGCRGYVHDLRRIERTLVGGRFRRSGSVHVGLWHVGIYDRV